MTDKLQDALRHLQAVLPPNNSFNKHKPSDLDVMRARVFVHEQTDGPLFECDCCGFKVCTGKFKGHGYYCLVCFGHYCDEQGAQTMKEAERARAREREDHAVIAQAFNEDHHG